MDYKKLAEQLRRSSILHGSWLRDRMTEAAAAIEALLAERDAAVEELMAFRTCRTCKNSEGNKKDGKPCIFGSVCTGQYWEWRGQKGENHD